jgi:hypothetical protein
MTNHDDSLLFVAAILAIGSWAILKGGRTAWTVASLVSLYVFYAMVLNDRRIAWLELLMALIAIYVLIGAGPLRRRINRWAIVAAPFALAYVVIGWGQDGALFAPIQALSSTGSNADKSSLARQEEARNILFTMSITGNPLLGTGWGVPYQKLTSIYNNYASDWILAFYTPHNSLLGMALFAGLVGILGIWGVVPVAAYLAARGYKRSTDPAGRTAGMAAVGILAAFSVHAFGDIGLQSFPCCLILGVALATAAKVAAWSQVPALAKVAPVPSGGLRAARSALPAAPAALMTRMQDGPARRRAMPTAAHGGTARTGVVPPRRTRP